MHGIRAHKLTIQAMWCILMPQLLDFIGERNDALKKMLEKSMQENDLLKLISILESRNFTDVFNGFVVSKRNDVLYGDGPNFSSIHSCPERWHMETPYLCIPAYAAALHEI